MDIYKIVMHEAGTLNSIIYPRLYWGVTIARDVAREIKNEGYYDNIEIDSVTIYRETPEKDGWYHTIHSEKI